MIRNLNNKKKPYQVSDSIANSLVSYYKFNDNALDSLGVNNGTASNIAYINAEILKALDLKGSSSGMVTLADSDTLSFVNQSFSFVTFLRVDQTSNNPRILEKRDGTNNEYRALIIVDGTFITVLFDNDLGGFIRTANTTPVVLGNWYVVVSTFNHLTNDLKVYVDNNVDLDFRSGGTFDGLRNTNVDFTIGKDYDSTNGTNSFNGLINAFGIFNKELTPTEVAFVVNKLKVEKQHLI